MKKLIFVFCFIVSFLSIQVSANDIRYRIPSYKGELTINEDNSAQFKEEVDFIFSSEFGGQYVSLGRSGRVPNGFIIDNNPKVNVYKNGKPVQVNTQMFELGDGLKLKVYNPGQETDRVKIIIVWHLNQILYKYDDVAVLNWIPISDWDQPIKKATFTVKTQKDSKFHQLNVHRGYFDSNTVEQEGDVFKTVSYDVKNQLELHGAWDSSIVNAPVIHQNYKDNFLKIEDNISAYTRKVQNFFRYQLFLIISGLLALSLLIRSLINRSLFRYKTDSDAQFYGLPGDMTPLMVADSIYNLNLNKLSPLNRERFTDDVSFENLLQATLLDLVDRKVLKIKEEGANPTISISSRNNVSDYEEKFLQMAFGTETKLKIQDLFSRYLFDTNISEKLKGTYSGKELENQVRNRGNRQVQLLKNALNDITESVKKSSGPLAKEHYRDMSTTESFWLVISKTILFVSIFILLLSIYYLMNLTQYNLAMFYLIAILVLVVVAYFYHKKDRHFKLQGILTEKGKMDREVWDDFRRMLKDINRFDQAEVESLIVWNRILVYATLFGYADQVEKYMNLHDINIQNTELGQHYYTFAPYSFGAINNIGSSGLAATQASNFSVSNGTSNGGGFSSGGFSGGGGGGGGGAF